MRVGKYTSMGLLLLTLLSAVGCEDDPILDPTDSGETDGGSYGNLNWHGTPDGAVVDDGARSDGRRVRAANPHIF